jgi:uncharacterized protein (DUF58 family)
VTRPTRLQQRWQAWWNARHPPSDTALCTQRNVYIVPTGAGALFALLLLALLVASINYQLNLGYLLTFLLGGVGLASMHGTHATLRGLQLQLHVGEPVFVGEAQAVTLTLHNPGPRPRHGIGLRWEPAAEPTWTDVPGGAAQAVHLRHAPTRRGASALPRLVIETRFPFGLFRAWSYLRAASPAHAWPRAETPPAPLPPPQGQGEPPPAAPLPAAAGAEASGVRPYRRGDMPQHIAWKKSAQSLAGGGGLVSRESAGTARGECRLTWTATAGLDTEQRLARLCAWVLLADRSGQPYALELPGQPLQRGSGAVHRRQCLDLLAGWPA